MTPKTNDELTIESANENTTFAIYQNQLNFDSGVYFLALRSPLGAMT